MSHLYIPKSDFDWEYYLSHNPDLKKAGLTNLDKAYRHWTSYGCYENRMVRKSSTGQEVCVKLKPSEKFTTVHPETHPKEVVIDLKFKIAVMIHIFDISMLRAFVIYANDLNKSYRADNFDFYLNIVEEHNPYQGDLKAGVQEYLKQINHPKVDCRYSLNRGGDIGGFLILSKMVVNSGIDYKYAIFVHSKNKRQWRIDLCHCIFNIRFEHLDKTPDVGMISAKKWITPFDPTKQPDEYRRFKYHMIDLCQYYDLPSDKAFNFVAGTMFLAKFDVIQYIVAHHVDQIYYMLNRIDSVDINWLTVLEELHKDPRGTCNDYYYRLKFRKPLMSDYMIEHTYERVLGLLCEHLGYKIVGGGT